MVNVHIIIVGRSVDLCSSAIIIAAFIMTPILTMHLPLLTRHLTEQPKWGPSHSVSDDSSGENKTNNNNKKPPITPGFVGTNLFNTAASPASPSGNSNGTHPTEPTTVGPATSNSQSTNANTNAAKVASSGSFWSFSVRPADGASESDIRRSDSNSSSLSNPAKAAADAASAVMMGLKGLMTPSSSSSSAAQRVTPSPNEKKINKMEDIPENEECWGFCGGGGANADDNNGCFADFGAFNGYTGGGGDNGMLSTPKKDESSPQNSLRKQYEVRLTSSYKKEGADNDNNNKNRKDDTDLYEDVPSGSFPFVHIEIPESQELERSVSELTMRSIGAHARDSRPSDTRRMAYYAVGRAGDGKSSGNRRCYFTGIAIPYATPFYAGCVQQGPRTLVVFCLPSALGLPMMPSGSQSKVERERYLQSLPNPDAQLMNEMKKRYSEPFDTLPSQVRSPNCWQLFVKFCFFSGLPIAEGEMHYRVKSTVNVVSSNAADSSSIPEEICLSHEVMEVVNGKISAEMLRLPNQKTFDYIRTQYSQQSAKLNAEVFDRTSWEMIFPEV